MATLTCLPFLTPSIPTHAPAQCRHASPSYTGLHAHTSTTTSQWANAELAQRHWEELWLELQQPKSQGSTPGERSKNLWVFVANRLYLTGEGIGQVGELFGPLPSPAGWFHPRFQDPHRRDAVPFIRVDKELLQLLDLCDRQHFLQAKGRQPELAVGDCSFGLACCLVKLNCANSIWRSHGRRRLSRSMTVNRKCIQDITMQQNISIDHE
ncbi:hypothetical protein N658DRAFT_119680 [Parathielavia hyrcaniae]|uniref:Uncharacterized protein n=1 Tax=Parathielavia hyrcaniae TaxID=113614 RepID=A0AAN6Q9K5_9PEZI|nr:hypothetical protein N658DRAFT_119680 [Parathielavia hyrcaniae]